MKLRIQTKVRFHTYFLGLLLSIISCTVSAQIINQQKSLTIGILPTLSVRVLLKNYQPLQTYLERELKRPIELSTAKDFKTFHSNTIEGKYDLVVTAAHLARLAQREAQYIPLAGYQANNQGILIESKNQPLYSIQAIKGKVFAFGDRNAMIVSQALNYLHEQNLYEGIDFTLLETQSHNSAAYSVQNHQSILAIISPSGFRNIPDSIKNNLKVFATLPPLPSLTWMANPRLTSEVPAIKAVLLNFSSNQEEGKLFFGATGYIGMREIPKDELSALDKYASDISNTLRSTK